MGSKRDSQGPEPTSDPGDIDSGPSAPGFGTRLHEAQLHFVFESMNQGIVFQSAGGQITSWNPAAERILGLSADELGSRTSMAPEWHAIKEDGTLFPGFEHPSMQALATGRPVADVTMGLRNPVLGETRWIIVSAVPLFEPGASKPHQVYASFTDVTELRRSQEELADSQHFVTSVLDLSPNLIYIYDLIESRNVYANREVTEFLGNTAEEVLAFGSTLFESILHPDDAALVAEHHARLVGAADGEVCSVDYRMKHADGEWRWLRSRDVPFTRGADGLVTQILGFTQDTT
jgi:PAS domain S-box-containing protein